MSERIISLLQQREIEARIVAPIYHAFAAELGEEKARRILAEVIRGLAHESGCMASETVGGSSLEQLKEVVEQWNQGGALELHVLRDAPDSLEFDVTRCRFAEMYRRLGLEDLGPILSCGRDGAMIEGFNPDIELTRTQTLMEGASHCDFRYWLTSPDR